MRVLAWAVSAELAAQHAEAAAAPAVLAPSSPSSIGAITASGAAAPLALAAVACSADSAAGAAQRSAGSSTVPGGAPPAPSPLDLQAAMLRLQQPAANGDKRRGARADLQPIYLQVRTGQLHVQDMTCSRIVYSRG